MAKYCVAGQATDDNTAHAHCMLVTYSYKHTLTICNIYCFSTATPTRLNATLYIQRRLVKSKTCTRGGHSDYTYGRPEKPNAPLLVRDTNKISMSCSPQLVTTYKVNTMRTGNADFAFFTLQLCKTDDANLRF